MNNAAAALYIFFSKNSQRVITGSAGVNNHWFFARVCSAQMHPETLTLPFKVAFQAKVIQAGFTNANNLGVVSQFQ